MQKNTIMPTIPWPAPTFLKSRKLLCAVIAYVAGIALARLFVLPLFPMAAVSALLLLGAYLLRKSRAAIWLLVAACAAMGFVRAGMAFSVPPMPVTGQWDVMGTVRGDVRQSGKNAAFYLTNVSVRMEDEESYTPLRSDLYITAPASSRKTLAHGDRISLQGKGYWPTVQRNPGGFDQKLWLAQNGAHMRVYADRMPQVMQSASCSVRGMALSVRDALSARMDSLFGGASPVVRAMLLGDDDEVPGEWERSMQVAGISHILSVSGLHVGLWYLMLNWLLRPVPASPRVRFVLLFVLLSGYSLLTGLEAPVVRSAVMLLFMHAAQVARRKVDPITSLAVAACLILLVRPLDLFAPGFQLSFCAVLGLSLLRPQLKRVITFSPAFISESLCTTMAAQVGILPAQLSWFGYLSVFGFFANLICVPLSGLLIPVAVVAMLLDIVSPVLSFLPIHAARGLVAQIIWLSDAVGTLPYSILRTGALPTFISIACFICLFLASSAVVWKWRTRAVAMFSAILLAVGGSALAGDFAVRYVQLDVGQALSGVLHVGRRVFVYDTGDMYTSLPSYLLYTGGQVEALFLSHPHADHTGGVDALLEDEIEIGTVYVPANADAFGAESDYHGKLERLQNAGANIVEVAAGDTLSLGGYTASVIAPEREPTRGDDPNDRSIVLLVDIDGQTLMLCGDADGRAEPLGVDCDVLQVAHHGSRASAGEAFLQDATPDIALISCGKNSYGHPSPDAIERLDDAGAFIYATVDTGAITVRFGGKEPRAKSHIVQDAPTW